MVRLRLLVRTRAQIISVCPEETIDTQAERSAHIVSPKDAFSTFTPVFIVPSSAKSAQATGKCEYGL